MSHAEEPEDHMATPEDRRARIEPEVGPGSLLVSSTDLTEPAFRRTVIYMIEHNNAGSLGVVINRPSETAVQNVLPLWAPLATNPSALYVGGPVKQDSALCLGIARNSAIVDGVAGLRRVDRKVVMVDLDSDPDVIAPLIEGIRIFAGYAGWTVGQLDSELERDDWMVTSSLPSDVLTPPRVDAWARVLRRQPLPLAMLASHPIEVERN